jgi:hypothetical protein
MVAVAYSPIVVVAQSFAILVIEVFASPSDDDNGGGLPPSRTTRRLELFHDQPTHEMNPRYGRRTL